MKTPGVYIVEKNAFPNSVVEVATAVPAFIGYTEKAMNGNKSLLGKPWRITSMAEFRAFFGEAPKPVFTVADDPAAASGIRFKDKNYIVRRTDRFSLYYQMLFFYANGGGPCWVVSVGSYSDELDKTKMEEGIVPLLKEQEPTMLVIPEAACLPSADDCYALQQAMLKHCGYDMQNRFAILDVYNGYKDRKDPDGDCVAVFREAIGSNQLDYGAAYYPWVNTSIVQENELDFGNLDAAELKNILTEEVEASALADDKKTLALDYIGRLGTEMDGTQTTTLHKVLAQLSPLYREFMKEMRLALNLLPVSAAMAGVYTMTDNTKGVC